jgi:hypothetical protein
MLAVVFFVSFLSVCGFYAYVFVQMGRERKRLAEHKKHLAEHMYELEREPARKPAERGAPEASSGASIPVGTGTNASRRRETLLQVSVAVGGLVALFAGIEILNSFVTRLH